MIDHSKLSLTAFVVAGTATLGSLFFSEVMQLPPCTLCWYQRVFMYPLVVIFGVSYVIQDRRSLFYSAPLIVVGWGTATYHLLLYYQIIPESFAPCVQGVSCTSRQIEWWGFVTIPLLSFLAFTALLFLCWTMALTNKRDKL